MKKPTLNTRIIRKFKKKEQERTLQMLTCYDFQTARLLNETEIDLVLVGDSLGNVILGYDNTIKVTLDDMITFSSAVQRGSPNKFVVADLPFGTYSTMEEAIKNASQLFQKSGVSALKLEGAFPFQLEIIERLTQIGIPIMGHIGLTPQSVHQQGGYYIHGKAPEEAQGLLLEAKALEDAGVFALVLECVAPQVAKKITSSLKIPTIGIGSGQDLDGQVLVINDLLRMGPLEPPKFCDPIFNFYEFKKMLVNSYLLEESSEKRKERISHFLKK